MENGQQPGAPEAGINQEIREAAPAQEQQALAPETQHAIQALADQGAAARTSGEVEGALSNFCEPQLATSGEPEHTGPRLLEDSGYRGPPIEDPVVPFVAKVIAGNVAMVVDALPIPSVSVGGGGAPANTK